MAREITKKKIKNSKGDIVEKIIVHAFIIGFAVACLIPFILVISSSLTSQASLNQFGYCFWPKEFSIEAYSLLFKSGTVIPSYGVTIFITVVGTVLSMLVTCACAYALSRKNMHYRGAIAFFIYFTMLFSGGLVSYISLGYKISALVRLFVVIDITVSCKCVESVAYEEFL